ncbi:hypothetical protein ACHAWC_003820 [Mediolabrus comicus]
MSAPEIVESTIPDHIDRLKESFLLAAAKGGRIVECQSLLELGADCDFAIDNDTPLLASARNGHRTIVALLLAHGADPMRRDANNNSVFHIIADTSGDEAMASLFSPHAATLAWDTNTFGKTAIDLAVERERGDSTFAEHLHTLCETNNANNSDSELGGQDSDSSQSSSSLPHITSLQIDDDDSNGSDTSCNDSNNDSDNNLSDGDFSVSNNDDTSFMSQLRLQLYQAKYALNEVTKDRDHLKVELDKFKPLFGNKEDDSLAHKSLNELQTLERQVKMALERIEKAKQNLEEEKLCVICRENPKVVLFMPCRHLCVCEECGHRVELDRCPLCRNVIAERFSVFS